MLIMVLDCGLSYVIVGLSTPCMPTLFLEDAQMGDDTMYPELLLTVGVVQVTWVLAAQRQEKLSINN